MSRSGKGMNLLAWLVVLVASALAIASLVEYFKRRGKSAGNVERKIDSALKKADKLLEELRRNTQTEGAS